MDTDMKRTFCRILPQAPLTFKTFPTRFDVYHVQNRFRVYTLKKAPNLWMPSNENNYEKSAIKRKQEALRNSR